MFVEVPGEHGRVTGAGGDRFAGNAIATMSEGESGGMHFVAPISAAFDTIRYCRLEAERMRLT